MGPPARPPLHQATRRRGHRLPRRTPRRRPRPLPPPQTRRGPPRRAGQPTTFPARLRALHRRHHPGEPDGTTTNHQQQLKRGGRHIRRLRTRRFRREEFTVRFDEYGIVFGLECAGFGVWF